MACLVRLIKNKAKRFAKQQRSNAIAWLACVYCYFLCSELNGYQNKQQQATSLRSAVKTGKWKQMPNIHSYSYYYDARLLSKLSGSKKIFHTLSHGLIVICFVWSPYCPCPKRIFSAGFSLQIGENAALNQPNTIYETISPNYFSVSLFSDASKQHGLRMARIS